MKHCGCNICREVEQQDTHLKDERYRLLVKTRKNVVFEDADFVVVPSLGPLNESHVMIVPKQHVNSFALLTGTQRGSAMNIRTLLSEHMLNERGRQLIFFESGAGEVSSHSGGCILHAHIHCCYFSEEFERRLLDEVSFTRCIGDGYGSADISRGYVWYKGLAEGAYICNNPELPSQFLRYLYAQMAGDARYWNWRRHTNYEGVCEVIENYRGFGF